MKKILDGAHNADLRRLYDFPGAIAEGLFGINLTYGSNENLFCSRLWDRSVEYIVATGEKYKVSGMNNPHPTMQWDGIWPEQFNSRTSSYKYTEDFVMQAYRPELMVNALNRTRDALNQNSNLNFNY